RDMDMRDKNKPAVKHFVGLDLGQSQDYTALCVLEQRFVQEPDRPAIPPVPHYTLNYLKRWQLKTSYGVIVEDVAQLVTRPPLSYPTLCVDQTGVGKAVVDLFRVASIKADLRPVLITAGHEVTRGDDGAAHVPKKELVSTVQVLLQNHRIKIAPLPERDLLVKELLNFKVKVTISANETFEAW